MSDSWRFVKTIAKKEVIEFVRDWRTLLALILIPLLIFPALFIALPLLLESEALVKGSQTPPVNLYPHFLHSQIPETFLVTLGYWHTGHVYFFDLLAITAPARRRTLTPYLAP